MLTALINRITEYIKIKTEQIKLEIIGHSARLLSHVLVVGFLVILGLFFLFFISFGLSAYFNQLFNSTFLGYLTVAGLYLLVIVLISILARTGKIQNWIEATIVKAMDEMEEDE